MLADHSKLDTRAPRCFDHLSRDTEIDGHWFLHQYVLGLLRAQFHRLEPVLRKRAHVCKVHVRPRTELFRSGGIVSAPLRRKGLAAFSGSVGTCCYLEADVAVSLCVLSRDRPGSDDPHSHRLRFSNL